MKTDYELIKDFPKVLFEPHCDGRVIERAVKDAHYVGKRGIEINLGEGNYVYRYIYKRDYTLYNYFGDWENALFKDKQLAQDRAQRMWEEEEADMLKSRIYRAYDAARDARASITFDFSKK